MQNFSSVNIGSNRTRAIEGRFSGVCIRILEHQVSDPMAFDPVTDDLLIRSHINGMRMGRGSSRNSLLLSVS
jgi:hypothetical protein